MSHRSFPRGVKAKPKGSGTTREEAKWLDAIVAYGCIACRIDGHEPRATVPHHILRNGRRLGHLFTIPLCDDYDGGHHQKGEHLGFVCMHPTKARFEAKYGTQLELLARLKVELGFFHEAEYTA